MDPNQRPDSIPPLTPKQRSEAEDFQAASRATAAEDDYDNYSSHGSTYTAPKHRLRKVLIGLLIIVLLAGGGFAVYKFVLQKDNTKPTSKNAPSNSSLHPNDDAGAGQLISPDKERYTSNSFGLEFDYPKDWKVNEPTTGGVLTVTSPVLQLKQADGRTSNGQVLFKVRDKQQALPEFDEGNALAAIESEKITYAQPSTAQRAATYLSFLTYASSADTDAIDGVYITGDVGYQKGQAIPKADFTPVDPVISLTFVKCSDSSCSDGGTPTGIPADLWNDDNFGVILKDMFTSLTIN